MTKPDAMPIPRIDDTLAALQGAKYFTTMDAMSDAIEGAEVMLYGVSLPYKESANCRLEAVSFWP